MIALLFHITNVDVGAIGWFKYSCIDDKDFYNKSLLECEGFNNPFSINENGISINTNIQIYPNPSENYFFIKSKCPITHISLVDINGRLVINDYIIKSLSKNVIEVNHQLNSGIYFIQVYSKFNVLNSKLLVR